MRIETVVGEGGTWKKNSHKSLIQIFLKCLGRPDRKGEKKSLRQNPDKNSRSRNLPE